MSVILAIVLGLFALWFLLVLVDLFVEISIQKMDLDNLEWIRKADEGGNDHA